MSNMQPDLNYVIAVIVIFFKRIVSKNCFFIKEYSKYVRIIV